MKHRPILPLRALLRDRKASSAVEFVLLVPILFGFFAGAYDLARGVQMKLALAETTARTAEMATGRNLVANSYDYLGPEAAAAYGAPLRGPPQVTSVLECDNVPNADFATGKCAIGTQTIRFVTVAISADYVPFFNWGGLLDGIVLQGSTTVRVQ